jgi:tetratricopeptide (TPR) repeat protein
MNRTLSLSLQLLQSARWVFLSFIFLFPLFFLPFTLGPLEINKQTLLLLSVCASLVLLIGAFLLKKEVRLRFGWVHVFPLLMVGVFIASAFFSLAPYTSWVGTNGSEYMSVLTWIGLALLFYLCTLFASELSLSRLPWVVLTFSASLVGLFGVLSLFGVSILPFFPALAVSAFNTIGTVNTFAVFLICVSLLACTRLMTDSISVKKSWKRVALMTGIGLVFLEMFIVLLLLDYALLWMLLLFGCASIFTFVLFRSRTFPSLKTLFIPVIFTVLSLLFWLFLPSPFQTKLPLEVSPSFKTSLFISDSVLRNRPMFGSGPGTYAMDYTKYHPLSINETDFWNTRFDRASSFVLTLAPTVGYFGIGVYLFFILFLFYESVSNLIRQKQEEEWIDVFHVFIPWLAIVLASFLFAFNITLVITLILLSGLLASKLIQKESHLTFSHNKFIALLSAGCFIALLFSLFIGIFLTTGRYAAETAYAKAVRADRSHTETKTIVTELDRAATLNQWNDDYVRNLSAALLLRVQDELKTVSPNSPLSDVSKQYLRALMAASINASARATELSPNNVSNWLARGEVYRSLSGLVDKAANFSLDAYTHAIDLEPTNPSHWMERGKTHMTLADLSQPLMVSSDVHVMAQAKKDWETALGEAKKDFTKATELKSNFAPAHYQLALVYEREGNLDLAISKLESVQKYNDTDIGVGFTLGTLYTKRGSTGDFERAKQTFLHVIALAPSYSDAHWFLASIYEKFGDKTRAIAEIETVLKLNPDNQIIKTRLEKLKRP